MGFILIGLAATACSAGRSVSPGQPADVLILNGLVFDGTGAPPRRADVALAGDRIVGLGDLSGTAAAQVVDATGLAVAPGFINVLSWATESLLEDGRSQSNIRQGVTLEVFGEGVSMGPLTEAMKRDVLDLQGDIRFEVAWTTLGEYLEHLERRGISPNVASFVGATTVRMHVLGEEDREPTPAELERMRALVREAMAEGALGVGSSLIYAPAFYAGTDELVALAAEAGESGGLYISHLRSEGNRLLEAVDELIDIARRGRVPAEIYHLKAAGESNWGKQEEVIRRIEAARAAGLRITADMYTYTAAGTGLEATMPPWVREGGHSAWVKRLQDPEVRQRLRREMTTPSDAWENFLLGAGSPDRIRLVGFRSERLKALTGRTLAEIAAQRGTSPEETIMDLVVEDDSRVETIYHLMSEANVRRLIGLPWMSFGSDAASQAPEGVFLRSNPHPRAYGNFARLLGKYARDEQLIPLEEAIRRLTSLPADNLHLQARGRLRVGEFADVVVFDPATIADHATWEAPHQYASGVRDVWVNGVRVLANGAHTEARPGRVVRGPGWTGWKNAER